MNIAQIEKNLHQLVESFNNETFIYDLLLAYSQPKATIKRLKDGGLNLSKTEGEIIWKKKLLFKEVSDGDLKEFETELIKDPKKMNHDPRFIIVTDYKQLIALDTKTKERLDIPIFELAKHPDFFQPWTGQDKYTEHQENPADVKAAEKMAKLYDEIHKDNPTQTPEEVHNLNVFLSRLLFCFFAEDTEIFEKSQFTHAISSHTQQDGSDLNAYLDQLFEVMNTPYNQRGNVAHYQQTFPFVNGGLFRKKHTAPFFTRKSRQMVIDMGELDWAAINPDIFGSMIQAVITPEDRGGLGMHYTSVPNIMKVIEPLFLNDLYEEFNAALSISNIAERNKKLQKLLYRISNIKLFDPACGSGNFLIIAYKELRKLEMKIFKVLESLALSDISLENFYGIELDDFAHEVAILSLWLAEHQMNQIFFKEFGRTKPALPLKETGNIVHGNACRIDWETVCPKNSGDEIYIMGNPPYLGARLQNFDQKSDMDIVFNEIKGYNNLDYIAAWFYLGKKFIENKNAKFAFVSTNSICQGTQVSLLWPFLIDSKTEIYFVHQSFKWKNNAKSNAAVSVMIIGLGNSTINQKIIFNGKSKKIVTNINPYGIEGENIYISDRKTSLSHLPFMTYGSMPNDNGELLLSEYEKNELIKNYPKSSKFIKKFLGANELMNGINSYCIWIEPFDYEKATEIEPILNKIENVKQYRIQSNRIATNKLSNFSFRFGEIRHKNSNSIVIPQTGSERREYLPIDFRDEDTIVSNAARVVYDAKPYLFAILSSKMHIIWVRAVAGRLKMDMQYSNTLCYNTFPFPKISETQKQELEQHVYHVLAEREKHSEKTLAQLYDPDKMPDGLREAHHQLDLAVERCYRTKPFESDEERLEYLFKLYEKMIEEEKSKGTLFENEKKSKKKK